MQTKQCFALKLFISILLVLIFFINTPDVKAQNIIFQDDFNDNNIGTEWIINNFTVEEEGSYSPLDEKMYVSEENNEIKMNGESLLHQQPLDDSFLVGNFGKSLTTRNKFYFNSPTTIQVEAKPVLGIYYSFLITIEINKDNRILFALVADRLATIQFDENNKLRVYVEDYEYSNGETLTISLNYTPSNGDTKALINGKEIFSNRYNGVNGNFSIGIASAIGVTGEIMDVRFDNFKVFSETPNNNDLLVPDIKQYSEPWWEEEYDTASLWSSSNPTIKRWGCALTSATMILNYYGHNTDPAQLNNWLKLQKDGYSRNGSLIWPSISRWTRINEQGKPILEFAYHMPTQTFISTKLDQMRPQILKMQKANGNTHFIVAKGKRSTDFSINDPASQSEIINLLSQAVSKWGDNVQVGSFQASNTDLSYLVLVINNGFTLKVSSSSGEISDSDYYIKDGPFSDPDNLAQIPNVESLNAFYYPKPDSGEYQVQISGNGVYQLDYYIYDEEGSIKTNTSYGILNFTKTDIYYINFDKDSIDFSTTPTITFTSTLDFWDKIYKYGYNSNDGFYKSIREMMENALKNKNKGNNIASKVLLEKVLQKIRFFTPKLLSENISMYFQEQIEFLLSNL